MRPTAALALIALIAAPATAQLTGGNTASTGSVSSTTTGSGSSSSSLGIGLGSGSLSGSTSNSASSSIPDVGGTNYGQPGTPLGSQSSLSARVNAQAGLGSASRLNNRLSTGTAGYTGSGASGASTGNNAVGGLSGGTTLSNAGQPTGTPLGSGN
ncbi:hypothetical protein ACFSGX_02000 [Sphingomonas arantia]|uniref:Uncharacterized protein n=1 Tax=Sphingomonas arantia TaxID=1460676 RepID=A0ABW4TVE2_9SPHN